MRALPALLLSVALLAGCSGSADESGALTAADSGGEAAPPAAGAAGGTGTTAGGSLAVTDLRVAPREAVIRTADLEVRVDDVREAADEAARLARGAGGSVAGEDRSATGDGGSALLTLRVPPEGFDALLGRLAALGDERSRRVGSEDVTDQVVDLEARLATQRASVERVRALLGEADALGEVVQVEAELTKRTADLEALQARLEALEAQVDLSTVTLRLDSRGGPVVGDALGFGDGLAAGWSAVVTTGRLLAVTGGALLPFLPVLLIGALLARRARSRRGAVLQP